MDLCYILHVLKLYKYACVSLGAEVKAEIGFKHVIKDGISIVSFLLKSPTMLLQLCVTHKQNTHSHDSLTPCPPHA